MNMNLAKVIGIVLIVAGALGLAYGGFSYTKDTQSAKIGPFVLQVQEKESFQIPILLSAGVLALGVFLLVGLKKK